jgi:hypothetical protein
MKTPIVAVVGASQTQPDEPDYQNGIQLGRLLVQAGLAVATGGYEGLMEAVSAGAAELGGRVIGVTAPGVFAGRSGANRYVTEERPATTLTERIHDLLTMADAVVALPGSLGTLTELVVAWNMAFVAPFNGSRPKPIVAVGDIWRELMPMLAQRLETNGNLVVCVETVEEAAEVIIGRLDLRPAD